MEVPTKDTKPTSENSDKASPENSVDLTHDTNPAVPGTTNPSNRYAPVILGMIFLLTICWYAFLITLAAKTANPVQLNLRQLWYAQHIWQAEIVDIGKGEIRILKDYKSSWHHKSAPENGTTITVSNLPKNILKQGEIFLVPTYKTKTNEYEVVPIEIKTQTFYFVYPYSKQIEARLDEVLPTVLSMTNPFERKEKKDKPDTKKKSDAGQKP